MQNRPQSPSPITHTVKASKVEKRSKKVLDVNKLTGKKLRIFRESMGFTVSKFADAIGVTPASIYRWEESLNFLKLNSRSRSALDDFLKQ